MTIHNFDRISYPWFLYVCFGGNYYSEIRSSCMHVLLLLQSRPLCARGIGNGNTNIHMHIGGAVFNGDTLPPGEAAQIPPTCTCTCSMASNDSNPIQSNPIQTHSRQTLNCTCTAKLQKAASGFTENVRFCVLHTCDVISVEMCFAEVCE